MARTVKISEFQTMQRGGTDTADPLAIDQAAEDAAATARLQEIGCGPHDGNGQALREGEDTPDQLAAFDALIQPKAEDQPAREPTMAEELQGLDVGAECSEEMSLGMVIDRVRDAAARAVWTAITTDAEIVAEAERIWGDFSVNRKGPREYDLNPDGTIRDWRVRDTTPDRGDVTKYHTITDEEPRFSGSGDGHAEAAGSYAVPTDQQFNGKLYRDAPDLANRAETLIDRHGFLSELINCEIRYFWKRKTGVSKGRVKIGFCKRASDLLGHFTGADFIIWLSATTARDGKFTDAQVEAALFHQLLHIDTDDSGNFIFAPHDFEGFAAEIRHYGTWTEDLKLGGTAFVAAHQMGLFDSDEDDDEEGEEFADRSQSGGPMHAPMRDGAGVLIHADGTALTDDEIEAMERHELEDAPADPDGDSPEDEDILADPAVI